MEGPVKWQAPDTRQPVIDVKTGCWNPAGHRWALSAFYRTGGYNDAVWQALAVGVTGLTSTNQVRVQVEGLEAAVAAAQGAIAGLRGDPRLEQAVTALQIAIAALAQVQARASGEFERRLSDVGSLVESLGARTTKATQTLAISQAEARQDAASSAMLQIANQQLNASNQMQLADEISNFDDDLETRARAALFSTGAVDYNDTTGEISLATRTGYSALTGTALRGTFATYTAPTISASPTQAEVQAIADALQNVSRRQKAHDDDLTTSQILGA